MIVIKLGLSTDIPAILANELFIYLVLYIFRAMDKNEKF